MCQSKSAGALWDAPEKPPAVSFLPQPESITVSGLSFIRSSRTSRLYLLVEIKMFLFFTKPIILCGSFVLWMDEQKKQTLLLTVLHRLMDIAKEMTREALPIKCLEAVILGMYPYVSQSRCTMQTVSIYSSKNSICSSVFAA